MPVLITRENAREYARRATIAREAKRALLRTPANSQTDSYVLKSLTRVRAQLEMLHDKLDEVARDDERTMSDVDRVVSAIERLRKVEQVLSNRPGPGNLKPSQPAKSRDRAPIAPVELPTTETVPSVPPEQSA